MAVNPKIRIHFSCERIAFSLPHKTAAKKLILAVVQKEKKKAENIHFTFCNDAFLLALNRKFLKHTTLTDIITFQYPGEKLSGELFISIPRVKENAKKFKVEFAYELYRVMIHGILHLCGYKDKTPGKKKEMRKKEEYYLNYVKK